MEPCGAHCLHGKDSQSCKERGRLKERESEAETPHSGANISRRGSTVTKSHAASRVGCAESRRGFAEGGRAEPKADSQHSRPLMFGEVEKMRRGSRPSSNCKPQIVNPKILNEDS